MAGGESGNGVGDERRVVVMMISIGTVQSPEESFLEAGGSKV